MSPKQQVGYIVMILRWTGVELANRRIAHDRTLEQGVREKFHDENEGPLNQLRLYFYKPGSMNAVWNGF